MSDIINLSLSELVLNIKDKKISSNEVARAYIERSKKSKHLNSKDIPDVLVQAYRENLKLKRKLGLVPTIGTKGQ